MESDPNADELKRLRSLGAWMREVGAVELETRGCCHGDIHIKLGPKPVETAPRKLTAAEEDEKRAVEAEEAAVEAMSDEERAHYRYWKRLTRSSGAAIPTFKAPQPKAAT